MKRLFLWLVGALIFNSALCAGGAAAHAEKLSVFVSIIPQKYFVQQIGRDLVDVKVMVPPGASPATYEPKPRQMADLSMSRIYFALGVPFETYWLEKIAAANPDMQVVHTEAGIKKRMMASHDDDEAHDHGHGGLDPHIWLSPPLVKVQSGHILDALKSADPAHADQYETFYGEFMENVTVLDQELRGIFKGKEGLAFMVFHPSWGYFADAYHLRQVPIEVQGKSPKPAQLSKLIQYARTNGIRMIFVQPQFSTKSAEVVAREIHGEVVAADPLAEDWLNNLRQVGESFSAALN